MEPSRSHLRRPEDRREPSLPEQRAESASKNTLPEGTGESDEEMGASKTQKTRTRKTKASQNGSRVEKAAPGRADLADTAVRSRETRKGAKGSGKRQEGLGRKGQTQKKARAVEPNGAPE